MQLTEITKNAPSILGQAQPTYETPAMRMDLVVQNAFQKVQVDQSQSNQDVGLPLVPPVATRPNENRSQLTGPSELPVFSTSQHFNDEASY